MHRRGCKVKETPVTALLTPCRTDPLEPLARHPSAPTRINRDRAGRTRPTRPDYPCARPADRLRPARSALHTALNDCRSNISVNVTITKPGREPICAAVHQFESRKASGRASSSLSADRTKPSKSPNVNLADAVHPPEIHWTLPGRPMNIQVAMVCAAYSTHRPVIKER